MKAARLLAPSILLALSAVAAPGCVAAPVSGASLALTDPLGLLNCEPSDMGLGCVLTGQLRLYVLPATDYACTSGGGATPDVSETIGETAGAVVDITVDVSSGSARQELTVPAGDWIVLVTGRGTDPVSMRTGEIVANGCAPVAGFAPGETREVAITVVPAVSGMGMCGDGISSPDEQCEPPGTVTCDPMCRTVASTLNTTAAGNQENVAIATRAGRRSLTTYDTDANTRDIVLRLLDVDGRPITSPSLLMNEVDITTFAPLPGAQVSGAPAVAPDGRMAFALVQVDPTTMFDVRVFFMDEGRNLSMGNVPARTAQAGMQDDPSIAFAGDGSLAVAFRDDQSATGVSITFFAPGTTSPRADATAAGSGTGGAAPAIAGTDSGIVLVYTSGGDVFYQRFSAAGTATDASGVMVTTAATGTQDQPAVAALSDGRFLVAWRDTEGDGAGTSIRARAFTSAGAPAGAEIVVDTTTAGDQIRPAAAGADSRFAVAWESAGSIRARVFSDTGSPVLSHESPPATDDFAIAPAGAAPAVAPVGSGATAAWLFGWGNGGDVFTRPYPR